MENTYYGLIARIAFQESRIAQLEKRLKFCETGWRDANERNEQAEALLQAQVETMRQMAEADRVEITVWDTDELPVGELDEPVLEDSV